MTNISIWNRKLNEGEIILLMNNPYYDIDSEENVARWDFSNTSFEDETGNGNNLSFPNGFLCRKL